MLYFSSFSPECGIFKYHIGYPPAREPQHIVVSVVSIVALRFHVCVGWGRGNRIKREENQEAKR